jgi:hypothetical protein
LQTATAFEASSGTLLNLAFRHETLGKTAMAWAEYQAAVGLARKQGREDRAATADAKVAALEPRLLSFDACDPPRHLLHLGLQQPEIEIRTLDKDRRRFLDHRGALVAASGLHYEFRKLKMPLTGAIDPWKGEPSIRGIF